MRNVQVTAIVPATAPAEAYEVLSDFERYPELTHAVRSVTAVHGEDGTVTSEWEVYFRNGILRWTEADRLDESTLTIAFEQTDGDFDHFSGAWTVEPAGDGCTVRFSASFDLGMPSIAHIIDPIAELALRDNIAIILRGLLGGDLWIAGEEAAEGRSQDACRPMPVA